MRFEMGNLQLFGIDLGRLVKRWKAGLQEITPNGLVDCFVSPAPAVDVVIEQDNVRFVHVHSARSTEVVALQHREMALAADGALRADILNGVKMSQLQLNLVMPEDQVMRKRITLPRVARHNLRTVVSYQIGRLTPFSVDKVFFDVLEVSASTSSENTLEVEFIAVLKTDAQPWIDQVERLTGLRISRLVVAKTDGLLNQQALNLFAQQRTPNKWWLRLNRNSMLLLGLVAVLLVTAVVPVIKLRALVVERKQEIKVLDERVTGLQEKRQILEHDLAALNYVLEQKASNRELSRIIDELTRIVPDEIFINSLSVQKQTVVISGVGTGVVDLIALLNGSPLFADAKFTSSITRAGEGQDIFTASMQLSTAVDGL